MPPWVGQTDESWSRSGLNARIQTRQLLVGDGHQLQAALLGGNGCDAARRSARRGRRGPHGGGSLQEAAPIEPTDAEEAGEFRKLFDCLRLRLLRWLRGLHRRHRRHTWDAQTCFVNGRERAEGHRVAGGEDGVRQLGAVLKQQPHRPMPTALGEVGKVHAGGIGGDGGFLDRGDVAGVAVDGGDQIRWAADHGDAAVAVADEVMDRFPRRVPAVDIHEVDLGAGVAPDKDAGDVVRLQPGDERIVDGVTGQHQTIDVAAADDALVELPDGVAVLGGVHEQGEVVIGGVAGVGRALDEDWDRTGR